MTTGFRGVQGIVTPPYRDAYAEVYENQDLVNPKIFRWQKPDKVFEAVTFICIGGGGGGGSGRKGAAATVRCGGGGGAGGAWSSLTLSWEQCWDALQFQVGNRGTGGAAQVTNSTDGNVGVAGGTTALLDQAFVMLRADGGGAGGAGTAAAGTAGGAPTIGHKLGLAGAAANGSGGAGANAAQQASGAFDAVKPGGGGAGGGVNTSNVAAAGGNGSTPVWAAGMFSLGGASGGGVPSAILTLKSYDGLSVGGGGGGGSLSATPGANGADGGHWGGGGGGGGAALDTTTPNSGKGGEGGAGAIIVICFG